MTVLAPRDMSSLVPGLAGVMIDLPVSCAEILDCWLIVLYIFDLPGA
jgi:hypothetical protein